MPLPSYEAMQTKVHLLASEKTRSREVAGGRYMHDKHCPATKIGRLAAASGIRRWTRSSVAPGQGHSVSKRQVGNESQTLRPIT